MTAVRRRACTLLSMRTKPVFIVTGSRTIFSPQFWLPLRTTSPGDWLWNTPSKDDSSYNGMWRGSLVHCTRLNPSVNGTELPLIQ
jgi:hypothetical protein